MALKAFLTQVLEVPEEIATTEAEHMKYAVSEDTVQKLEKYIASIINLEEFERAKNHKKERSK